MVRAVALLALAALGYAEDETSLLQARRAFAHKTSGNYELSDKFCVVAGDPHVKTFDANHQNETCLGPMGDYWLVNSAELKVQARYMGRERHDGYSFIYGLVMTGDVFQGGTLHMPTINGGDVKFISASGVEQNFRDLKFNEKRDDGAIAGIFSIQKKKGPKLAQFMEIAQQADAINAGQRGNTFYIDFPHAEVMIVVNQGIQQGVLISVGQDALTDPSGQCGNNNGDATDDVIELDNCPGGDGPCLFSTCPNPQDGEPRVPEECPPDESDFYDKICKAYHQDPVDEWTVWNCKTDCCAMRSTCPDRNDNGETATCVLRGDPHIKTWDSDKSDGGAYGPLGDYWLVNNKYMQIQGRYQSFRGDRKAQLFGIAIKSPLLGTEQVMLIPARDRSERNIHEAGKTLTLGGQPLIPDGESVYENDHFTVKYGAAPSLSKFEDLLEEQEVRPYKNSYTLDIRSHDDTVVKIIVNQKKIQSLLITSASWLLESTTGQCGNYNGDKLDDIGHNLEMSHDAVADFASMFPDANPQQGLELRPFNCPKASRKIWKKACHKEHKRVSDLDVISNCVVDCCGPDGEKADTCEF